MTQQANQTAPQQTAPTTPAAPAAGTTFEQRLAAVYDEIRAEGPASTEAAVESAAGETATPPAEAPVAGSPAASVDAVEKARLERQARLDALKVRERETVDAKSRLAEQDRLAKELETERAERARLAEQNKQLVDISKLDEASFFDLAKRARVDPGKLGEWIRDSITNPERLASTAAERAMDPKLSALEKRIADQDATIRSFLEERAQEKAQREFHQATEGFLGFVNQNAENAPLASAMLTKSGRDEFLKIADMVGAQLPRGAGPQAVLDAVEQFLDGDGRAYAQQLAEMYGLIQATPSNGSSIPTPKSAAAKATTKTVSNALAQERASVMQEDGWAKLPYEERLARLKAG